MKILVIAQNIGRTAPGIVFEALIKNLSERTTLDVICSNYYPSSDLPKIRHKQLIEEPRLLTPRITAYADRLFNYFFEISWRDWLIGKKKIQLRDKYDAIIAFGSAGCLSPLQLACKYREQYKTQILAYLVDACPTPYWWSPPFGQSGVGRFLYRVSKKINYFISSNPQMLVYQKQFLCKERISTFDILYTASLTPEYTKPKLTEDINFVYLGSLYGLRTPKYLIEAFRKFVKDCPSAKLVFVGTNSSILNYVTGDIRSNIEVKPFTDCPEQYFQDATALLDIDADFDNDIFLSSKFTNYIFVNRPIICETGKGSPVRELASGLTSILLCEHNSEQLYEALKQCVNNEYDYSERENLKELFSPRYNAEKIISIIKKHSG